MATLNCSLLISFVLLVITKGTASIDCPVCSNPYDYTTCTGSTRCGTGFDYCQLRVNTGDNNRIEYECYGLTTCFAEITRNCDPNSGQTCNYCCSGSVPCQIQRDDLFGSPSTGGTTTTTTPPTTTTTTTTTTTPTTVTSTTTTPTTVTSTTTRPTSTHVPDPDRLICPVCTNPYDHTTCTAEQTCAHGLDMCELHVYAADRYRLEYTCETYSNCVNHEVLGCNPQDQANNVCSYCCGEIISCMIQRNDLFEYVFPPFHPPRTPPS